MDERELSAKYERANELFRQNRFQEALELLQELETAVPNNPTLVYARALVLVELGRFSEADHVCDQLIRQFHRPEGVQLKARIAASWADAAAQPGQPLKEASAPAEPAPQPEEEARLSPETARFAAEAPVEERAEPVRAAVVTAERPPAPSPREVRRGRRLVFLCFLLAVAGGIGLYYALEVKRWEFPPLRGEREPPESLETPRPARSVTFPEDQVLGWVFSRAHDAVDDAAWEFVGAAGGTLTIPGDQVLRLVIEDGHWLDLESLAKLDIPNLQSLEIANVELSDQLIEPIAKFQSLRDLALNHTFLVTDAGLAHLVALKSLRRLSLQGVNLATDAALASIAGLTDLRELNITETAFGDAGLAPLAALNSLEALYLPDAVTDAGLPALRDLTGLKRLGLGAGIAGDGLAQLAALVSLETLELRGEVIGPGLEHLSALPALRSLRCLGEVTAEGLSALSQAASLQELQVVGSELNRDHLDALGRLASLRMLRLDSVESESGWEGLAECLNALPALEELAFNYTALDDAALAQIKGTQGIATLDLSGSAVTDAGMPHLRELTNLRHLMLDYTALSGAGLTQLAAHSSLKTLSLVGTAVTESRVAELRAAMPGCTIVSTAPKPLFRRMTFPAGPPRGVLYTTDDLAAPMASWKLVGRASGRVSVPADRSLVLRVGFEGERDLSFLDGFGPDHFQGLALDTGEAAEADLVYLADLTGLRSLTIANPNLTDAGLDHLSTLRSLRRLALTGAEVTDAGVARIAEFFPDLESLQVSACERVTDAAADALASLHSLKQLDLSDTRIGDATLARLGDMRTLESLWVSGSGVTAAGIAEIREALPACAVHFEQAEPADAASPAL